MKPSLPLRALCAGLLLWAGAAQAVDYRSVTQASVLYDAPSEHARKLFVIRAMTPVEVIVPLERWVKIRDSEGSIAWVARADLGTKRTLIVRAAQAAVRERPDANAPAAYALAHNVVVEMIEPPALGWIKISHPNGGVGYVSVADVWGF